MNESIILKLVRRKKYCGKLGIYFSELVQEPLGVAMNMEVIL
jgi:hypothetical protein